MLMGSATCHALAVASLPNADPSGATHAVVANNVVTRPSISRVETAVTTP
jgi:hypothetical protein